MRREKILALVQKWKISKKLLASKTNVGLYTLRMKLSGKDPRYKLTDSDLDILEAALKELKSEIEKI